MPADDPVTQFVWLIEDHTIGVLIQHGAYVSLVRYAKDGTDYEVYVENDEFEYLSSGEDEHGQD